MSEITIYYLDGSARTVTGDITATPGEYEVTGSAHYFPSKIASVPLDARFADFKVRLAVAVAKHGLDWRER